MRTPLDDFKWHYFGSSVTYKDTFSLPAYKRNPQDYLARLCWTFESVDDAIIYEEKINKRILQRQSALGFKASFFANRCYGKSIVQSEEVKEKQRLAHNSLCDCGCGRSKAKCNAERSSKTRNSDICECNKIIECDGSLTTYQCAGLRCSDRSVYVLKHYKSGHEISGSRSELALTLGCDTSFVSTLLLRRTKSIYGYTLPELKVNKGIRVLNEQKTIKHSQKGVLKGSLNELSEKIGSSPSHLGMLFNEASSRVLTVKGWFNPEVNPQGAGGYGSGAVQNRWWQNLKKQDLNSIMLWKDVELVYELWIKNQRCGYITFGRVLTNSGYVFSRKRVENLIKLFKNETEYQEMLETHKNEDFEKLVIQFQAHG